MFGKLFEKRKKQKMATDIIVPHAETEKLQQFLDTNQYSENGVLRYERIFGRTFVSTGGRETTEKFLQGLNLQSGTYVLDVGCGIGGSAFLMDLEHGCKVRGVDLSTNMIAIAKNRKEEVGSKNTDFFIEDITKAEYPESEFDLIYSRDAIMHLEEKEALYKKFLKWLKPGGRIFMSEYAHRHGNVTEEFKQYVKTRDYKLVSPQDYEALVTRAGFENVQVTDLKEYFIDILTREMKRTESIKDEYIKEFSQKDYDDIVNGWAAKIVRVGEGSHRWISIAATKPTRV